MALEYEKEKERNLDTDVSAGHKVELEHYEGIAADTWDHLLEDAIKAEEVERGLSLRQAFKLYPKSILWSLAISLCIVM